MEQFKSPASMDKTTRLLTYGLGYGVGIGIPMLVGIALSIDSGSLLPLLLPVFFAAFFIGIPSLYKVTAFSITEEAIIIHRILENKEIPLRSLFSLTHIPTWPTLPLTLRLWGVAGLYGYYGYFWNKSWRTFTVYTTRTNDLIDVVTKEGKHIIISPDNPTPFLTALESTKTKQKYDFTITQ
jgi:hypothetical protein